MPSRVYFSNTVVPELYTEVKRYVESEIEKAPCIALTTDGWTSRPTENYNTYTAHFINDDWQMKNYVLETKQMNESHTSQNLATELKHFVAKWGLQRYGMSPCVTTDNASNIVGAVKLAGLMHVRCVAHSINLSTQKGLQITQMNRLLGRVRRIVGFFHRSTTANAVLKTKQTLLEIPKHKLINDVPTRWNSSFDMLERFLEQQTAIEATLLSKDVKKNAKDINTLSETDISETEAVVKVLKPIKTVTTILCEEKSPTLSMIHPLKSMLMQQLEPSNDDGTLVASVKAAIAKDLSTR